MPPPSRYASAAVAKHKTRVAAGRQPLRTPNGSAGAGRDNTRDNIHPFYCVQCVHQTSQFGPSGRPWKHLHGPRLRALWTLWSVEVRVLSGALGKPRKTGLFHAMTQLLKPSAGGRPSGNTMDVRRRARPTVSVREDRGGGRSAGATPRVHVEPNASVLNKPHGCTTRRCARSPPPPVAPTAPDAGQACTPTPRAMGSAGASSRGAATAPRPPGAALAASERRQTRGAGLSSRSSALG